MHIRSLASPTAKDFPQSTCETGTQLQDSFTNHNAPRNPNNPRSNEGDLSADLGGEALDFLTTVDPKMVCVPFHSRLL